MVCCVVGNVNLKKSTFDNEKCFVGAYGPWQTDATSHNIVACCWPTMLRPFVWA